MAVLLIIDPVLLAFPDATTRCQRRTAAACALVAALVACSPVHDWRESRPDDGDLRMLFPCRPERNARAVLLAGDRVALVMQSCAAGGQTYSLAWAAVGRPEQVTATLEALRAAASGNIGATPGRPAPRVIPGATPNEAAAQLRLEGRFPDGRTAVEHAVWFVHGLRVYQAAVLSDRAIPDAALETFLGAIRVVPSTSR